jgi:hypothetical protein
MPFLSMPRLYKPLPILVSEESLVKTINDHFKLEVREWVAKDYTGMDYRLKHILIGYYLVNSLKYGRSKHTPTLDAAEKFMLTKLKDFIQNGLIDAPKEADKRPLRILFG